MIVNLLLCICWCDKYLTLARQSVALRQTGRQLAENKVQRLQMPAFRSPSSRVVVLVCCLFFLCRSKSICKYYITLIILTKIDVSR